MKEKPKLVESKSMSRRKVAKQGVECQRELIALDLVDREDVYQWRKTF